MKIHWIYVQLSLFCFYWTFVPLTFCIKCDLIDLVLHNAEQKIHFGRSLCCRRRSCGALRSHRCGKRGTDRGSHARKICPWRECFIRNPYVGLWRSRQSQPRDRHHRGDHQPDDRHLRRAVLSRPIYTQQLALSSCVEGKRTTDVRHHPEAQLVSVVHSLLSNKKENRLHRSEAYFY